MLTPELMPEENRVVGHCHGTFIQQSMINTMQALRMNQGLKQKTGSTLLILRLQKSSFMATHQFMPTTHPQMAGMLNQLHTSFARLRIIHVHLLHISYQLKMTTTTLITLDTLGSETIQEKIWVDG